MSLKILSSDEVMASLKTRLLPHHQDYLAMYSSWLGGITKDPVLMMVPVDDHIVHRGDGVFEAFKAKNKKVYLLGAHLDRLEFSARGISLPLPMSRAELTEVILETLKVAGADDALVRLYMARGPGGFTTNPYESVGTQLYIVITKLKPPAEALYQNGVKTGYSLILSKDKVWAAIKCCNYLPNVMMKKEAVDRGLHFTVSLDEAGNLGEGSTENLAVVDGEGFFRFPAFDRTLKGTTLTRLKELAPRLIEQGLIKGVVQGSLAKSEQSQWREMMLIGTTIDVLPVAELEGVRIGDGRPGPVAKAMRELLAKDMGTDGGAVTTAF